jgi:protease I
VQAFACTLFPALSKVQNIKDATHMNPELQGVKVAILATDGFEQSELTSPRDALKSAGARVDVVAPKDGEIQGMQHHEKGDTVRVDRALTTADAADYDALVLPGGVANPDALRINRDAVAFIEHFVSTAKPIAAICHGPWSLIEVPEAIRGRTLTSWPSLRTDITNAGANWVDQEVVVDGNLVTSRKPDDLKAFNAEMIALFSHAAAERGG